MNPPREQLKIDDPDLRLSLDIFFATTNASQDTYNDVRNAIVRRYPDSGILSYDQVKRRARQLSGIVPLVFDMCTNTCMAYTGPYKDMESCPYCGEPRYEPPERFSKHKKGKKAWQEFYTILIGPQLQAMWRQPSSADQMRYRERCTDAIIADLRKTGGTIDVYDDIYTGRDYLDRVESGEIHPGDMVLVFSIDGAQLHRLKKSDCWIYIWVVLDQSPKQRYKKKSVFPGGFVPGPNNPKDLDSFIFPGLHHLSALQNEGLTIWDAAQDMVFTPRPMLAFVTADAVAMAALCGWVGHHGKYGCCLLCGLKGRHKPGAPHYYPALLKPDNCDLDGSNHPDYDVLNLPCQTREEYEENLLYIIMSLNQTQYNSRRKETGLTSPSIFLGIPRTLGIPACFPGDLMHHIGINLPDLLLNLWQGKLECDHSDDRNSWDWAVLKGKTWKLHGKEIADCQPYLPTSFDCPPRNPAEKISSGYKAWEFLTYLFVIGPGALYAVLPDNYWRNFCKLVVGVRIAFQQQITRDELLQGHKSLLEFCLEFEHLYYQRKLERLHFVRQSMHALLHIFTEVTRVGPVSYLAQWTMERMIGDLGAEIRQPSNPYANLSQRGLIRAQINAIQTMEPDFLAEKRSIPRGGVYLGFGYALLCAKDRVARDVPQVEAAAIHIYLISQGHELNVLNGQGTLKVQKWARLRLPNDQIVRSAWKENQRDAANVRKSRNVKVCIMLVNPVSTNLLM